MCLFYVCDSVICGLTEETKPAHLIKAALEAVCYQVRDILEAMSLDCGYPLSKLLVDGGMTANDFLMQMQADYCGIPVGNAIFGAHQHHAVSKCVAQLSTVEFWKFLKSSFENILKLLKCS